MQLQPYRFGLALFLAIGPCLAHAQDKPAGEQGTFTLYKFARAIGKETWSIKVESGKGILRSDFKFTDRNTPVPLKATYTFASITQPLSLEVDGNSSRFSKLKDNFTFDAQRGKVALVRDGKTSEYPAGPHTFLIDGYSPVAMQQQLMRYWLASGKPASIDVPALGAVHIEPAGDLALNAKTLHGYTVSGLVWGSESLWLDDAQQLVALVSNDAEFDHFEAVREEIASEASLAVFTRQAVLNNLQALGKLAASAKQPVAKKLAITHVDLIDGTGAATRRDVTVFVENGKIARIDPQNTLPASTSGLVVIDGRGKFLIPGLWDMHAHYEQVEWGPIYLAAGVTTVRDCGNEFDYILAVRDALQSDRGIGPRLLVAGIVDGTGPATLGAVIADTPEQAREVVRRYKKAGALQIKIYSSMKPALVPVITEEAHRLGMTVTGHVPIGMTASQAVAAGYDGINHLQYLASEVVKLERGKPVPPWDLHSPQAEKFFDLLQHHHTVIDDTVALYESQLQAGDTPLRTFEPGIDHVAAPLVAALDSPGAPPEQAKRMHDVYALMLAALSEAHRRGLPIVAGTDQAIPGYSLHREMEIYVQAGFTPMEALQAATIVPARVMKLDRELGTVEVGKRADMVLIDADPLQDIHNTRRISKTISGGSVYDPAPLWRSVDFKP
ncbi:amidohydrolase family protein [Solilutibacter silvestris]|uniref:amidohydrolase family protein n=1 Tax=Solilutibacter silvestris TaxID=1645665 RepID=UPI003D33F37E